MGYRLFEYAFEFAEKIDYEIADFSHSSVNDIAVTLDLIFDRLWPPLKGITISKQTYIGTLFYIYNFHTKIWGLTKDRFLSQRCHWHRCD
jgi:hypothetical protein